MNEIGITVNCTSYGFAIREWLFGVGQSFRRGTRAYVIRPLVHRGLKLDGAIGQGEICNSLKSENFSKSFLSHIGKNKIKF